MRNILVSAYSCEPNKGSEPGVGWHWVLEMAKVDQLWVVTRENNKEAIEVSIPRELRQKVVFVYYDLPKYARWFKRKERGLYAYYALWQWCAYRLCKRWTKRIAFDYCMHLTFGNVWLPTFMHKLGIPFIWGPLGGGEHVPYQLIETLPWPSQWVQRFRGFLIKTAQFNPLFVGPSRAACAIIVRTDDTRSVFPDSLQEKVWTCLETGFSSEQLSRYIPRQVRIAEWPIRLIYTGRLIGFKNVAMVLYALSQIDDSDCSVSLTIVGDGPDRRSLEGLAERLRLSLRVRFLGAVSQSAAIDLLRQCDVYVFPSYREGGTWSLMEAMAVGLPVICLEASGMKLMTDDRCAIRIAATTYPDMTKKMADGIRLLARNKALRREMGECGQRRIQELFLWHKKGEFIERLLSELDSSERACG